MKKHTTTKATCALAVALLGAQVIPNNHIGILPIVVKAEGKEDLLKDYPNVEKNAPIAREYLEALDENIKKIDSAYLGDNRNMPFPKNAKLGDFQILNEYYKVLRENYSKEAKNDLITAYETHKTRETYDKVDDIRHQLLLTRIILLEFDAYKEVDNKDLEVRRILTEMFKNFYISASDSVYEKAMTDTEQHFAELQARLKAIIVEKSRTIAFSFVDQDKNALDTGTIKIFRKLSLNEVEEVETQLNNITTTLPEGEYLVKVETHPKDYPNTRKKEVHVLIKDGKVFYAPQGTIEYKIITPDSKNEHHVEFVYTLQDKNAKPIIPSYFTEGNNQSYKKGSAKGLTFKLEGDIENQIATYIDKEMLNENEIITMVIGQDHEATNRILFDNGKVLLGIEDIVASATAPKKAVKYITLPPALLDKLQDGPHTLTTTFFESSAAVANFTITPADPQPETEKPKVESKQNDQSSPKQDVPIQHESSDKAQSETNPNTATERELVKPKVNKQVKPQVELKETAQVEKSIIKVIEKKTEKPTIKMNTTKEPVKTADTKDVSIMAFLLSLVCLFGLKTRKNK